MRLEPGFAPALLTLGATLNQLKEPEAALAILGKALAADSANGKVHFEMGQALLAVNKQDEALPHLRRAVELAPADSQTAYALLRILSARNSPEAPALAVRVRELKKGELAVTQARVLSNFGLDAASAKDWRKAVLRLREALEACGACAIRPALHKNLGLVLARSGDIAAARKELELARRMDPEDQDIEFALDILPSNPNQLSNGRQPH